MMPRRSALVIAVTLVSALALGGCSKSQAPAAPAPAAPEASAPAAPAASAVASTPTAAPVAVASVDLGSAVGADEKVSSPTTAFAPKDTIYASVATTGSGTATLAAKWTYQDGQTVHEDSKSIAPTGPADTAFSISKPDGWPAGNYKVAISLDGTPVATRDFSVK